MTDPAVKWDPGKTPPGMIEDDHFYPYAMKDGVLYRAARPAGLFIMLRLDTATAGTDAGWVYGTVATDGRATSGGRVTSCMGCHVDATHERLFGVAKAQE